MKEKDIEQLLRVKDVASIMKLSPVSIWRLAKEGKIPKPVKIGDSSSRWKHSEIKAFLEQV